MIADPINSSEKLASRSPIIWFNRTTRLPNQHTIIIVGVERGGTSMVAGVIRSFGLYGGRRLGRNHENPAFLTDNENDLKTAINRMDKQADVWWVKIPKLSTKLDFITSQVRNPIVIFVTRNWTAILNSWIQRGAGDPNQIAKHCLYYYSQALSSISKREYPAFAVDYEYACRFPNAFIKAISEAIRIEIDNEMLSRAQKMITEDGGGYIDLPEFNFSIKAIKNTTVGECEGLSAHRFDSSEVKLSLQKHKLHLASHQNLKSNMVIGLSIKARSTKFQKYGIRFYADYGDGYFPAHSHRPELKSGENYFLISFDKIPKKLALGPVQNAAFDVRPMFIRPTKPGEKFLPLETKQNVFELFVRALRKKVGNW